MSSMSGDAQVDGLFQYCLLHAYLSFICLSAIDIDDKRLCVQVELL